MNLDYNKCRLTAIDPKVGTSGSAGIDFFIPYHMTEYENALLACGKNKDNGIYIEDKPNAKHEDASPKSIVIPAGKAVLIPSGIRTHFDMNNVLVFFNKSGISTKMGLAVGACVIDSDYRGEIHYHLINTTNEEVRLDFGQKVVQGLFIPHNPIQLEYMDGYTYDVLIENEKNENERGTGGFGSTGV